MGTERTHVRARVCPAGPCDSPEAHRKHLTFEPREQKEAAALASDMPDVSEDLGGGGGGGRRSALPQASSDRSSGAPFVGPRGAGRRRGPGCAAASGPLSRLLPLGDARPLCQEYFPEAGSGHCWLEPGRVLKPGVQQEGRALAGFARPARAHAHAHTSLRRGRDAGEPAFPEGRTVGDKGGPSTARYPALLKSHGPSQTEGRAATGPTDGKPNGVTPDPETVWDRGWGRGRCTKAPRLHAGARRPQAR